MELTEFTVTNWVIIEEQPEEKSVMKLTKSVYDSILETVGTKTPESGGMLLGNREDFLVRKFHFDEYGSRSPGSYDPDVDFLNMVLKREAERGNRLLGFVHSHPRGARNLSSDWGDGIGDLGYIERFFEHIPSIDQFLTPIVFSESDGGKQEFIPYIAKREDVENYCEAELDIIEDKDAEG